MQSGKPRIATVLIMVLLAGVLLGCAGDEEPSPEETEEPAVEQAEPSEEVSPSEAEKKARGEETARTAAEEEKKEETARKPSPPEAVRDYTVLASKSFVMPEGPEKYNHEYTARRLRSLAGALVSSASTLELDTVQRRRLDDSAARLRSAADAIQAERFGEHSPTVREALLTAAKGFEAFTDKNDDLESIQSRLEVLAEDLDPDVPYLEQEKNTEAYFRKTAEFFDTLYR